MSSSTSNSSPVAEHTALGRGTVVASALVLAATYLLAVALLDRLDPYRSHDNVFTRARAALGPGTQVLALGTSHVLCGIDPSGLRVGAMNMATAGSDYRTLSLMLACNEDRLPNLRTALLELDNLCLFNTGLNRKDFFELYDWGVSRADLPLTAWGRLRQAVVESPAVAPLFFSRRLTPRAWWREPAPERMDAGPGFQVYTGRVSELNDGLVRIRGHEQTMSAISAEVNRAALRHLVAALRARGVRVIFITLPHQRRYTECSGPAWRQYFAELERVAREAGGESFTWWNYDGDPAFSDDDFHDGHHVNARGAARFTRLLADRLAEEDARAPSP